MRRSDFFKTAFGAVAVAGLSGIAAKNDNGVRAMEVWPRIDPEDEQFWKFVRTQFPLTDERAYLNTGGLGASPYAVIDAVKAKIEEAMRQHAGQ